jgi:molybdopterin synthase sulfur carrier subunit
MMEVTVKFFANFREVTGKGKITITEVSNIRQLLNELVKEFGQELSDLLYESSSGKLRDNVNILVNGRAIGFMGGIDAELKDGDTIAIFPPISGG